MKKFWENAKVNNILKKQPRVITAWGCFLISASKYFGAKSEPALFIHAREDVIGVCLYMEIATGGAESVNLKKMIFEMYTAGTLSKERALFVVDGNHF